MAIRLTDLPDGALEIAAGYLTKPARALLVVAISSSKEDRSAITTLCRTILAKDDWSSLDFGELETDLTNRLTDSHIHSILECIDATHNLKSLKMHGCISILGHGLKLLRQSTVIERLDLVITKDRNDPFNLAEDDILPIIDDIMTQQPVSKLEVVQLPKNWIYAGASETAIEFARRYNRYKINRGRKCRICIDEGEDDEDCKCENVCYGCFAPFHELCPSKMGWPMEMITSNLYTDSSCQRMYCRACYKACVFCCSWCGDGPWNGGDKLFCNECSPLMKCEGCGDSACRGCAHLNIKQCASCFRTRCKSCVYYEYRMCIWNSSPWPSTDPICEACLDSSYVKQNYLSQSDESESNESESE